MDRFLHRSFAAFSYRISCFVFAIFWIAGLLSGILMSYCADVSLFRLMLSGLDARLSIVGFLSVLLLPLFLSFLAAYLTCPLVICVIAYLKAFLFAFLGMVILHSFRSAAWLIHFLMMFSDLLILPVLWWFWIQVLSGSRSVVFRSGVVSAICIILIGIFDFTAIAPFLASLI